MVSSMQLLTRYLRKMIEPFVGAPLGVRMLVVWILTALVFAGLVAPGVLLLSRALEFTALASFAFGVFIATVGLINGWRQDRTKHE